jgi:hypothetical protein
MAALRLRCIAYVCVRAIALEPHKCSQCNNKRHKQASYAANKEEIHQRHYKPGMTHEQQLQSVQANAQDARDDNVSTKNVTNLRCIVAELTYKLHSEDAESLTRMVRVLLNRSNVVHGLEDCQNLVSAHAMMLRHSGLALHRFVHLAES